MFFFPLYLTDGACGGTLCPGVCTDGRQGRGARLRSAHAQRATPPARRLGPVWYVCTLSAARRQWSAGEGRVGSAGSCRSPSPTAGPRPYDVFPHWASHAVAVSWMLSGGHLSMSLTRLRSAAAPVAPVVLPSLPMVYQLMLFFFRSCIAVPANGATCRPGYRPASCRPRGCLRL